MLAATSHIDQLGQNISIRFAINGIDFFLFCCFVVDLLAAALAAVVAPAGAVLLIFYLFQHTRRWAENWIGKMVSLMLLQLFVAILLQVIIAQFTGYMRTSEAQSVSGIDIDEAINALWSIAWTFGVGLLLLVSLPAIASSIGGGHVSNLVVAPIRFGQVQMARAVASGIRAANRSSDRISNAATSTRSATPTAPSPPRPLRGSEPMIRPRDIFQASEAAAAGIKAGQWFEAKVRTAVSMATFAAFLGVIAGLVHLIGHDAESGVVALLCLATVIGSLLTIVILRLLALRIVKQPVNHEEKR